MNDNDWDERLLDDAWRDLDGPGDAQLRDSVLADTLAVVQGRAGTRRSMAAFALIAMFAAGFGVRHAIDAGGDQDTGSDHAVIERADDVDDAIDLRDAEDLEVRAEIGQGADRARWYKLAGDAWLSVHGDTVAATRCYQHHLGLAGTSASSTPEDSWLLLALRRTLNE